MGTQSRQQGLGKVGDTRHPLPWATKGLCEPAPLIYLHQQVFNADEWQSALNGLTQLLELGGQLQGIAAFQVQTALPNSGKGIAREPTGSPVGHLIECLLEPRHKILGCCGQLQVGVGRLTFLRPPGRIIDQIRKGDVPPTRGEEDVT